MEYKEQRQAANLKKLEAEAEAALAEAERNRAWAADWAAQARITAAKALAADVDLERLAEKRSAELVSDDRMHIYRYFGGVGSGGVRECIAKLTEWSRLDALEGDLKPITVEFYSPGGDVVAGLALFDCLRDLSNKGHHIITRATGYAASMAGILLQAGDERVMSPESWLLIHEGSASASGDMGKIEDTVNWFKKIDERILNIFYERSREGEKPLSKSALRKAFDRTDWWLDADQALMYGFCDKIE